MSRLYHGTPKEITGGMILPPNKVNGTDHTHERASNAYATSSLDEAWSYAAAERPHNYDDPDPKYRSRVYEVAHAPDEKTDGGFYYTSPTGFKITGTQWSKVGEQMTFPQVNWNAYASRRSLRDYNHWSPSDEPAAPVEVTASVRRSIESAIADSHVHDSQLNLFSGRTKAEHDTYENTAVVAPVDQPDVKVGEKYTGSRDVEKDPLTVARQQKVSGELAKRMSWGSLQFRGAQPD